VACCSAVDSFSSIVETVGGEQEKTRAKVAVVDDCPSARTMALTVSNRIKHRAKASYYNKLSSLYRECIHVFFLYT
jgi:hypothetical protein